MTADLSRLLNALGLVPVNTVVVLAFVDQFWFRDLPCPICMLQRAAFVAAGSGIALNRDLRSEAEPLRPRHPRRHRVGGIMSADQC